MDVEILKAAVPKIESIYVEIKGIKYKGYDGKTWRTYTVTVWCNPAGEITHVCSRNFSLPACYCEREFGLEQWKELKKLCKNYVRTFVENHPDYYYVRK